MTYYIPLGSEVWAVKKISYLSYTGNDDSYWRYWQHHMDNIEHKGERLWWIKYKKITTTKIELSELEDWNNNSMPKSLYVFVPTDHDDWLGYIIPKSKITGW